MPLCGGMSTVRVICFASRRSLGVSASTNGRGGSAVPSQTQASRLAALLRRLTRRPRLGCSPDQVAIGQPKISNPLRSRELLIFKDCFAWLCSSVSLAPVGHLAILPRGTMKSTDAVSFAMTEQVSFPLAFVE